MAEDGALAEVGSACAVGAQPQQAAQTELPPKLPWRVAALLTTVAAGLVVIAEIDRLTATLRDAEDRSVSLLTLLGPARLWDWSAGSDAFGRLRQGAILGGVGVTAWLLLYVVLHLVVLFAAVRLFRHALALRPVVGPAWRTAGSRSAIWDGAGRVIRRVRRYPDGLIAAIVLVWVAADVVVALLAMVSGDTAPPQKGALTADSSQLTLNPFSAALATLAGLLASIGWLLIAVAVIVLLRRLPSLRGVIFPVYLQRFTLVVVLIYAALALLPGGEMLDQFPDAARGWLQLDGPGPRHGLIAMAALLGVAFVVFALGRMRARQAWRRHHARERDDPVDAVTYLWWFIVPWILVQVAILMAVLDRVGVHFGAVDVPTLLVFVGPVAALPVLSVLLRNHDRVKAAAKCEDQPDQAEPNDVASRVWIAGDVLAVSVVAVSGLGMVRAFTAPAVLGFGVAPVVALVLGFVVAVGCWPASAVLLKVLACNNRKLLRPDRHTDKIGLGVKGSLTVFGATVAVLLVLLLIPLKAAAALGVIGMTAVALGCLVVLASLASLQVLRTQPLPVFSLLRLRRTPVITLLVAMPVLASLNGGDEDVHEIRQQGLPSAVETRPTLPEAFEDWLGAGSGCVGKVPFQGHKVRPLVLVAAAGGGIRAAVWTAYGVQRLVDKCGVQPVFLSSGVSGGSVGLVVARGDDVNVSAEKLAGPSALAAAIDGMVVRDLLGGLAGVRVFDLEDTPGDDWLDRAGLMEHEWGSDAPALREPFLGPLNDPGATGRLLLNSASVGTACRVIVSEIRLGTDGGDYTARPDVTRGSDQDPDCHSPVTGLPAGSIDLLSAYQTCLGRLTSGTAAMLSARFPYVTPSGVVPGCEGLTDQQLVDGGYAEGSGLGTLADLAPAIMDLVREHNARVLRGEVAEPLVLPTVVFFQNHFGTDLSAPPSTASSELLVPPVARRAQRELVNSAALRQRLESQLSEALPCVKTDSAQCPDYGAPAIAPFVLVAPATQVAVAAPLGWTMSDTSIDRLRTAMDLQAGRPHGCNQNRPPRQPPRLCDLFELLERGNAINH